jgi:hypothetical protein
LPPASTYARMIAWDSFSPQPQLSVPNVMVPSEMRDTSNPDEPSQRYFMRYPSHDDEIVAIEIERFSKRYCMSR